MYRIQPCCKIQGVKNTNNSHGPSQYNNVPFKINWKHDKYYWNVTFIEAVEKATVIVANVFFREGSPIICSASQLLI